MQKWFIVLTLALLASLSFASAISETMMMPRISYDMCMDRNGLAREQCFGYATPLNVTDCELLQSDFNNYETLIVKCYSQIAVYNNTACDQIPLTNYDKQLCYVQAGVCSKIANSSQKDNCYKDKLDCANIVDDSKKTICTSVLNQKNFDSSMGNISFILVLLILVLFPIFVLAVIIKTAIDLFQKTTISLPSWAIRLALIGTLLLIWIIVLLIMVFTAKATVVY
ncbi:MAG: hypothetical protein WCW44_02315 [archaeon]|jgi:hypothetical protein